MYNSIIPSIWTKIMLSFTIFTCAQVVVIELKIPEIFKS